MEDNFQEPLHLSVVIPVHNEEANIVPLLIEIRQHLNGKFDYEVIVVDDQSTDRTEMVLNEFTHDCRDVRVIRLSRRCGQSGAVLQGVRAARNPIIATLDGDGQNDPADIASLLACYCATYSTSPRCLIIGKRHRRRDSMWRRFSSKIANSVREMVLHDHTPDSGCGIKVFPRDFFLELPAFNHMHRFLPALATQLEGQVISVEVNHRPRKNGTSHYGALDRLLVSVVDLFGVAWLGRRALKIEAEKQRIQKNG